jgi:hypothetical protein
VVTKCVGHNGTSYSDGPCPKGASATTVIARSDLNVTQGLAKNPTQVLQAAAQQPIVLPSRDLVATRNAVREECDILTDELHEWDARARQPLPGTMQDWIRDKQRQLRARKFELKC